MKHKSFNWCLRAGLLLIGILFGVNHFYELPHFIYGLGLGIGLALELIGVYAINHDIKKIRECKKRVFSPAGKKACRTQ